MRNNGRLGATGVAIRTRGVWIRAAGPQAADSGRAFQHQIDRRPCVSNVARQAARCGYARSSRPALRPCRPRRLDRPDEARHKADARRKERKAAGSNTLVVALKETAQLIAVDRIVSGVGWASIKKSVRKDPICPRSAVIFFWRLFRLARGGESSSQLSVLLPASALPQSHSGKRSCPLGSRLPTSTASGGSCRSW